MFEMEDTTEKIVNKLKELIEDNYKLLDQKDNHSEEGNRIENDNLVLRYFIDLKGGVTMILGSKQDKKTYIALEHERIPHYAPPERECRHHFNKEVIKGNSFNISWIGEIDNLREKLREA